MIPYVVLGITCLWIGWKAGAWWAGDCAARALADLVQRGELRASVLDELPARPVPKAGKR